MKISRLFVFFLLLCVTPSVFAQDVIQAEVNNIYTVSFSEDGGQAFLQFTGNTGDIVYLLAGTTELVFGSEIELDIRDSVGRSVGFKESYSLEPFVLVELEADGTYTAVVTLTTDEAADVEILIGSTQTLSESAATFEVEGTHFATLMPLQVDADGLYNVSFSNMSSDPSPTFDIRSFGGFISTSALRVGGDQLHSWTATIELEADEEYVVFMGGGLLSLHSPYLDEDAVEVTVSLTAAE